MFSNYYLIFGICSMLHDFFHVRSPGTHVPRTPTHNPRSLTPTNDPRPRPGTDLFIKITCENRSVKSQRFKSNSSKWHFKVIFYRTIADDSSIKIQVGQSLGRPKYTSRQTFFMQKYASMQAFEGMCNVHCSCITHT